MKPFKSLNILYQVINSPRSSATTFLPNQSPRCSAICHLANQPNKKKVKPKAIVAIACKLLRIIYRMLTEKKPFDSTYDQRLREKASLRLAKSSLLV